MNIVKTTIDLIDPSICFSSNALLYYPTHKSWIDKCISEKRTVFVCKENDVNIGCAIVKEHSSFKHTMKLCYLYIDEKFHNNGIGTNLLNHIEKYALSLNNQFLYSTIKKDNNEINAFYERKNYQLIDITGSYEYVYMKELSGHIIQRYIHFISLSQWNDISSIKTKRITLESCDFLFGSVILANLQSNKNFVNILGVITIVKDDMCSNSFKINRLTVFKNTQIPYNDFWGHKMLSSNEVKSILFSAEEDYERLFENQ